MPDSRTQSIALGVAWIVVPIALAVLLLVTGLLGSSLALVWVSIVVSLAALPAAVVGVVILVRVPTA